MNQSNPSNLTTIDPCADGIRPHRCIQHIPPWPDNSPRMEALRRELMTTGICQPVQMTPKHEIVDADSRERWRAARMLQLGSIPVALVPPEQAVTACLNALVHRRHLTKGAQVYLLVQTLELLDEETRQRNVKNLAKSPTNPLATELPAGVRGLAARLSCSHTLVEQAQKVLKEFASPKKYEITVEGGADDGALKELTLREYFEPRILAEEIGGEHETHRPMGLGAVIAGIATLKEDRQKFSSKRQLELDLFGKAMKSFCVRAPRIEDEAAARKVVRAQMEAISDPEELERVMKTAALVVSEARRALKQPTED